jgi:hypothetical protein
MCLKKLLNEVYNYQILLTISNPKKMKLHSLTNDEKMKLEAFLTERQNSISGLKKITDFLTNKKWVVDKANDFLRMWDFNFSNDELSICLTKDAQSVVLKKECGVFIVKHLENRFTDAPHVVCVESNLIEKVLSECHAKLKPKKQPKTKEKALIFI